MKRASFLALCLGLALATITSAQAPNSSGTARKKRVAVFDFDYATVHQYSYAIFGRDIDVGRGISDLLVTMLVKDGTYSVIERKNLDKILGEQNFSNSDRANPASAAKIGKLLGVDAIIVGSVTQFAPVGESWELRIRTPAELARFIAYKGSITVNGVSLTVNRVIDVPDGCELSINLIPHTLEHTTLGELAAGRRVNLEIDLIARYVERMLTAPRA